MSYVLGTSNNPLVMKTLDEAIEQAAGATPLIHSNQVSNIRHTSLKGKRRKQRLNKACQKLRKSLITALWSLFENVEM
jgi:hypothetical protein